MPAALRDETARDALFASTRWSVIRAASESATSSDEARNALAELCGIYWRPVYIFLRRQGIAPHDAQDLTQGFFAELIGSRAYTQADQAKGRFRSFLLGTLKHFVADNRDRERAQKRGGGVVPMELNEASIAQAEAQAARFEDSSPDCVYDREWAAALLQQAMGRLEQECELAGKHALFKALRSHLSAGTGACVPYDELASRVGRPAATLRSDVARLRARYRAILREEVGGTVAEASEVDEELRYLSQVMAR